MGAPTKRAIENANARANRNKSEKDEALKEAANQKKRANAAEKKVKELEGVPTSFGDAITKGIKASGPLIAAAGMVGTARGGVSIVMTKLDVQNKIKEHFKTEERAAFTVQVIEEAVAYSMAFVAAYSVPPTRKFAPSVMTLACVAGVNNLANWLIRYFGDKLKAE